MANATTTTLNPLLKPIFTTVQEQFYPTSPLIALLKKNEQFQGEHIRVPIRYAPQHGSHTFSYAKANKYPSGQIRFEVTRAKDYAIGGIEIEALRAATDKGAVAEGLAVETEALAYASWRALAHGIYRNGGGARAQVASGMASNTITLANTDDIVFFEKGMMLDGSAADGTSGAATVGGTNARIVAIDRSAGTLTNSGANWNAATGINGLLANWYLFRQGDFSKSLKGLLAWLPLTAPTAGDSFFNVDRSVDTVRLAGNRVAAKASIESTLLEGMRVTFREGGMCSHIFVNPLRFAELVESLGSKVQYQNVQSPDVPKIGFKAVTIVGQNGEAKVVSDPNCPTGYAFGLKLDEWELASLGPLVAVQDDDGNKMLRDSDDDSVELRIGSYRNLICKKPGYNFVATLPV